ncbi:MAG: hypothetical protein ABL878_13735 [Burkholderiales bacterium]
MNNVSIRNKCSFSAPNARIAILVASLMAGATVLPGNSLAADVFRPGNTTGSVVLGAGRALDRDYTILGATLGYMASEGLMLGISANMWLGNDPSIYKITPEIRYHFPQFGSVRPYAGAFLSRTIYDGPPDRNTYGARGGVSVPFSTNAAFNAGLVYEKVSGCDTAVFRDCGQLYSEASVMFSF